MKTPAATKPQPPVMSPTGESVPRTGPGEAVVDLMDAFTEEAEIAGLQTGGEAKTTDVRRFVPRVPRVVPQVAAPAGLPGQFPQMPGLPTHGQSQVVQISNGSIMGTVGTGGRKKRKSMKKKQTKKRKSMKKKKTMKRKSMKRKSMKKRR